MCSGPWCEPEALAASSRSRWAEHARETTVSAPADEILSAHEPANGVPLSAFITVPNAVRCCHLLDILRATPRAILT